MIPRLTICFALSVLLHGLLLLPLIPAWRTESKSHGPKNNTASSKLNVFLEAASSNRKLVAQKPVQKYRAEIAVPASIRVKPATEAPQLSATNAPRQFSASVLFRPPFPVVRQQMQMDYRQMNKVQARLHASQQARFLITNLQTDIEQRINQHSDFAVGKCTWLEKTRKASAKLQCDSKALKNRMQAEEARLTVLRNTVRTQGTILDGFTISTSDDRTAITYHVHSANTAQTP